MSPPWRDGIITADRYRENANVITNTIRTAIVGSTVETDGNLNLDSISSSVIRTLGVGVSASSAAFQFTAMGNAIVNTIEAVIDNSMIAAGNNVSLSASEDNTGGGLPFIPESWADAVSDALDGSPISPDGNIFALMVSVAGGGAGMNAAVMGNAIANNINSQIRNNSVVLAGASANMGYDVIADGFNALNYTITPSLGNTSL